MEVRTSSNTGQMSLIFIWLGLGSVTGVLAIGPLFDRVNNMLLLTVCFLFLAVSVGLAPTWPSLPAFQASVAVAAAFYTALMSGVFQLK